MTAEECRRWREDLGAFVLGQLDDTERAAVQAHVDGCAECRAERDLLAPLAKILPLADPDRLAATPAPPRNLGRKVLRTIEAERRSQRRRRLRFGLGFAGAAATAAAIGVLALGGSPEPTGTRVAFAQLPAGMEISGHLQERSWGTEVSVYVHGVEPGTRCDVFLRGPGGRVDAGSFRYTEGAGGGLSAAIDLSRVRAIGIRAGNRTFVQQLPSAS
jgi:anti-sigma factor RsiW